MQLTLYSATNNNSGSDEDHARNLVGISACRGAIVKETPSLEVVL